MPRSIFRGRLRPRWAVLAAIFALGPAADLEGLNAEAADVLVFAAASTAPALDAAIEAYGEGAHIVASYAASSALARQIEHGAPADVFLSANTAWMDYLEDRGLIQPETRCAMLGNRLVLIAPAGSPLLLERVSSGTDLKAILSGGRLAIGDPAHVPAGIYARQALETLGLWSGVSDQLAPTADVRRALTLVARGETPLGIVYASDAAGRRDVRVLAPIPAASHPPISYAVALLSGRNNPEAKAFLAYLTSAAANATFRAHGFEVRPCSH